MKRDTPNSAVLPNHVHIGTAGEGNHRQIRDRVISKTELSHFTCRCWGGNPFVEAPGLHGLMLICAQLQAVLKEDQSVGRGNPATATSVYLRDVAGYHQPVVSWLSMVRPIQFKREMLADRCLRYRTAFGLQPDDLVTIVDKQVEVLQEVLAEYTSYVADDVCQITGAEQI